jgi:hypothetical protein
MHLHNRRLIFLMFPDNELGDMLLFSAVLLVATVTITITGTTTITERIVSWEGQIGMLDSMQAHLKG